MLALLLVLLLPTAVSAVTSTGEEQQEEASPPVDAPEENDAGTASAARPKWKTGLRNVSDDARYLVTFPTRITRRGVLLTSAFGAGLVGLIMDHGPSQLPNGFRSGARFGQVSRTTLSRPF